MRGLRGLGFRELRVLAFRGFRVEGFRVSVCCELDAPDWLPGSVAYAVVSTRPHVHS